jgi:hypothetical protein
MVATTKEDHMRLVLSTALFLGLAPIAAAAAPGGWACVKDGNDLTVSGKTTKDKKKACEGQGGTWTRKTAAPGKAAKGGAANADGANGTGGGGGW